jgi:hypothetical protein
MPTKLILLTHFSLVLPRRDLPARERQRQLPES